MNLNMKPKRLNPAQVATELSTLLDASALISSSIEVLVTITSAASGTGFSVGSSLSSNTNGHIYLTTIQGTGKFAILGEPKFSSVTTGTQEVYNYSVTTNGVLCDSTSGRYHHSYSKINNNCLYSNFKSNHVMM